MTFFRATLLLVLIASACASERKALSRDDILRALNDEAPASKPNENQFTLDDARELYWRLPTRPEGFDDPEGPLKDERLSRLMGGTFAFDQQGDDFETIKHRCMSGILLEQEARALPFCERAFAEAEGQDLRALNALANLAFERVAAFDDLVKKQRLRNETLCFDGDDDACDLLIVLDDTRAIKSNTFFRHLRGRGRVVLYLKGAAGERLHINGKSLEVPSESARLVLTFEEGEHSISMRAERVFELRLLVDKSMKVESAIVDGPRGDGVAASWRDFEDAHLNIWRTMRQLNSETLAHIDEALLLLLTYDAFLNDEEREGLRFLLMRKLGFAPQVLAYLLRTTHRSDADARIGVWQAALTKLNSTHSANKVIRSSSSEEKFRHLSSEDKRYQQAAIALRRFDKIANGFLMRVSSQTPTKHTPVSGSIDRVVGEASQQKQAWLDYIRASLSDDERRARIVKALNVFAYDLELWRLAFAAGVKGEGFPQAEDLMLDEASLFERKGAFRNERLFVGEHDEQVHLIAGRFVVKASKQKNVDQLQNDLLGATLLGLRIKSGEAFVDIEPSDLSSLIAGTPVEYIVLQRTPITRSASLGFLGDVPRYELGIFVHPSHSPRFNGFLGTEEVERLGYRGLVYKGPALIEEPAAPEYFFRLSARLKNPRERKRRRAHPFLSELTRAIIKGAKNRAKAEALTDFVFSNISEGDQKDAIETLLNGEGNRLKLLSSLLAIAGEKPETLFLSQPSAGAETRYECIRLRRFLDDIYIFSNPQSYGKIPREYLGFQLKNENARRRILKPTDVTSARLKTTVTLAPTPYVGVEPRFEGIVTIAVPASLSYAYRWPFLNKSLSEQKAEFEAILAQVIPSARLTKVAFSGLDSSTKAFGIGALVVFERGPIEVRDSFSEVFEGRVALEDYLEIDERVSPLLLRAGEEEIEIIATLTPETAFVQGPEAGRRQSQGVTLLIESTVSDSSWLYRKVLSVDGTQIAPNDFRVWRRQTQTIVEQSAIRFELAIGEDR